MNNTGFEIVTKRATPKRGIWVILGAVVFIGGIVALSLLTRDVQVDPPRMFGSVWTAGADGTHRLYYLMEENRARTGYFDSDASYSYTLPYSIFTLHARNGRDGAAPAVNTIARTDGGVADSAKYQVKIHLIDKPEILGPQDGVLWLWSDGLEARNLKTLELVWNTALLKQLNPELGPLLPADRKYFKVLGTLRKLVYKGADARFFQVDSATGKIDVLDDATLAPLSREYHKTAETAFTSLYPDTKSLWNVSVNGLMWDSVTADGVWCAVLTPEQGAAMAETAAQKRARVGDFAHADALRTYLGPGSSPAGEVQRYLYRGTYTTEPSRTTTEIFVILDPASVAKVSPEPFLMGGLLRKPNEGNAWPLDGGKSYLVMHRKILGEKSPWYVTRIGLDGTLHWTRSTGLADPQHLCDGNGAVVFTGFADKSQPTGERPNFMVFIDEQTGQSRTLNLLTNEFAPAN